MRKSAIVAGFCLLLAGLSGCSDCGKKEKNLLALVPADVPGVLVLPDLAQTVRDVSALKDKFSVGPLAAFIDQGHIEMTRILGFDPLDIEDLEKLGLDPARGLAIVPVGEQPVLIAGVSNRKALKAEIEGRMKQLAAAEDSSTASHDGIEVTTISARLGEQTSPRLRYAFVGNYVIMASPETDPGQLARLANLKKEQSLEGSGWFANLKGKTAGKPDVLVVVNGTRPEVFGLEVFEPEVQVVSQHVRDGLVLAFSIDSGGIDTRVFLGLDEKSADELNAFTGGVADAHLERYLPDDTVLAFKARVDVGRLLDGLLGMDLRFKDDYDQAMAAARRSAGADLEKGTLRNLTGNLVIGLSLGKADQINRLFSRLSPPPSEAPPEAGDAPAAFQLFYWAQIQDAAAWVQVLENILPLATEKSGLTVAKSDVEPLEVIRLSGEELEYPVFLLQKDDLVGGCLGPDCASKAAALVAGKHKALPAALSPGTKRMFDEPSLAVGYVNCALVFDALSGLDAASFGDGGMLVKMILGLALTAVKNLKEITGVVRFSPGGVSLSSRIEIQ